MMIKTDISNNLFVKIVEGVHKRVENGDSFDSLIKEINKGMLLKREGKVKTLTWDQISNGQFIGDAIEEKSPTRNTPWWKIWR